MKQFPLSCRSSVTLHNYGNKPYSLENKYILLTNFDLKKAILCRTVLKKGSVIEILDLRDLAFK